MSFLLLEWILYKRVKRQRFHCFLIHLVSLISVKFTSGMFDRCQFNGEINPSTLYINVGLQCWNISVDNTILWRQQVNNLDLVPEVKPLLHIYLHPIWHITSTCINYHIVISGNATSEGTWVVPLENSLVLNNNTCIYIRVENWRLDPLIEDFSLSNCFNSNRLPVNTSCSDLSDSCREISKDMSSNLGAVLLTSNSLYFMRWYDLGNFQWSTPISLSFCLSLNEAIISEPIKLYWNLILRNSSCSGSSNIQFIPSSIFTGSINGIFVIGNGILYSPNSGETFYYLDLSYYNGNITSFDLHKQEEFVFIIKSNENISVWYGLKDRGDVIRLYPSLLMDSILNINGISPQNIISVQWNETRDILMNTNINKSLVVPLYSIIQEALEFYSLTLNSTLPLFPPSNPSVTFPYHKLIQPVNQTMAEYVTQCPFTSVTVQSPFCSRYTRTQFFIDKSAQNLTNFSDYSQSYTNCSSQMSLLPMILYLPLGGRFIFTLQFTLRWLDERSLFLSVQTSSPNVIKITLNNLWDPEDNKKTTEVELEEAVTGSVGQVLSGEEVAKTVFSVQVWNAGLVCAIETGQEHVFFPDVYHLPVRVGCPPGLSFIFDSHESLHNENHFCQPENNISCFYFEHDFYPVFKIKDEVTGIQERFLGNYTLRVIAGGTSIQDLTVFNRNIDIESTIWTPLDDSSNATLFGYSHSGLKWLCSPKSPCGDILPKTGRSPEYYLLLEASNMGVGLKDSYCNFTVQFTIRVHGIGMGLISNVLTFVFSILLMTVLLLGGFVSWYWQVKILYCRDLVKEKAQIKTYLITKQLREILQQHRETVAKRKAQTEEDVDINTENENFSLESKL